MNKAIYYKIAVLLFFASFLYLSCNKIKVKENLQETKKDSITIWIQSSKSNLYNIAEQKKFLKKAYQELKTKPEDNSKANNLSSIAYRFYELKDTVLFNEINKETLSLAYKLKDSFVIADAHWSYGEFYIDNEIYDRAYLHYNSGYEYFNKIQREYEAARMLYSMAFIKGRYRDYSGSEVLIFEAIKKFKKLKNFKFLYMSYLHLGSLQHDIQEYDKALFYQNKALNYIKKIKGGEKYYAGVYNNIGYTYQRKRDYKKAIEYLNKALKIEIDIYNYARVIDHLSYSKLMLNDTLDVKKHLLRSLKIRDSINNKAGVVFVKIRLAKYYIHVKDTISAIKYSKEANVLAKELKNGVDYLASLKLLSELKPKKSKEYLDLYIKYNDSLIDSERKTLNKFTRIEFETDEHIADNKRLSQQKIWISVTGIGIVLILSLIYFLRIQKSKTEKLYLETEQQKANEQVYLLTLKQQSNLEEERTKERNRISQELHDGILGKLFGTRVGMGFLDIQADEEVKKQHQSFLDELQDIEKEIREVSHKLSDNFNSSDVNFTTIINQLLETKSKVGDFQFQLNIDQNISWKTTDEIIKVNVYRIIQEALQNTIKHANAKHVSLDFHANDQYLVVKLKDDGHGFNINKSKKGIGIKNIKSRIEKLNGTLEILSAKNKGTSIEIKIPIH